MLLKIYSVFDSKIMAYSRPFVLQTKGEALRGWVDVVNDPSTAFAKHPGDYTLFELGEWDDSNAKFNPHTTPISIGTALEYQKNFPDEGPEIKRGAN